MKYSIIGAGIGGLTTALALEKKGIEYHIFEKSSELSEVGAGIWLAPNALQVLEYLGVLDDIKEKGNTIDRITLGKANLSPISDNSQEKVTEEFGFSTIAIHRADLQNILLKRIPDNKISLGKGFQSFEKIENENVKLKFDDGSEFISEFLIGADGINSRVRKQLFPESETRFSGQTCWRGVATIELDKEFENRGIELWGNQIRFGISKISKDKVYWFAVALDKPNQKDVEGQVKQKLLKMYLNFHPLVKELIAGTPEVNILRNDINDLKPLENWYKNNICLIGDAGHGTTPNIGQGGAQAIEDAYYLSNLIQANPNQNVFNLFQQKRQSKVNMIVKQSWTTGKMAHWRYGKSFRNFLLKNLPKSILEKKMFEMYQIEKHDN
ncbi:MAG: 2-polyprenyl-6-methoxyphenol hydroxylase-like FAD-dependent oxidoreductase [Saprospiraceae bacterium]|jgi:2-polyprenyl-6-methoxyphenol hydroxylase-like FAD-dependent oxidoreductase